MNVNTLFLANAVTCVRSRWTCTYGVELALGDTVVMRAVTAALRTMHSETDCCLARTVLEHCNLPSLACSSPGERDETGGGGGAPTRTSWPSVVVDVTTTRRSSWEADSCLSSCLQEPVSCIELGRTTVRFSAPATGYPDLGFSWFSSVHPVKYRERTWKLGHDRFLPNLDLSFTYSVTDAVYSS
jgi:hypothetical protein